MTWYLETICYYYFLCLPSDVSHTASPVPETCKKSTGSMPTYTCQSEAVKLRAETIQFSDVGIMYSPLSVLSWAGSCLINMRIMFLCHVFSTWIELNRNFWPNVNGPCDCDWMQLSTTDWPSHPPQFFPHHDVGSGLHTGQGSPAVPHSFGLWVWASHRVLIIHRPRPPGLRHSNQRPALIAVLQLQVEFVYEVLHLLDLILEVTDLRFRLLELIHQVGDILQALKLQVNHPWASSCVAWFASPLLYRSQV